MLYMPITFPNISIEEAKRQLQITGPLRVLPLGQFSAEDFLPTPKEMLEAKDTPEAGSAQQ